MRNDAVDSIPSTVLRRNVTQRRSQGRAKDRTSIGETSVPLEALITRKSHQREKDVEYQNEAQVSTPKQLSTSTSNDQGLNRPNNDLVSDVPDGFHRLWQRKMEIDGELDAALQAQDEHTYYSLEAEQRDVNAQIYSKLFASTPGQVDSKNSPASSTAHCLPQHVLPCTASTVAVQ
jgi:hypothetical protein